MAAQAFAAIRRTDAHCRRACQGHHRGGLPGQGEPGAEDRAPAVQAMLKAIGIETALRTVPPSVWVGEAQKGTFDITVGLSSSTLMDSSDYFRAWYSKDGPQNYSQWHNTASRTSCPRLPASSPRPSARTWSGRPRQFLTQDLPLLPVSWEKINDGWFNYVKGHNPYNYFGLYELSCASTRSG